MNVFTILHLVSELRANKVHSYIMLSCSKGKTVHNLNWKLDDRISWTVLHFSDKLWASYISAWGCFKLKKKVKILKWLAKCSLRKYGRWWKTKWNRKNFFLKEVAHVTTCCLYFELYSRQLSRRSMYDGRINEREVLISSILSVAKFKQSTRQPTIINIFFNEWKNWDKNCNKNRKQFSNSLPFCNVT